MAIKFFLIFALVKISQKCAYELVLSKMTRDSAMILELAKMVVPFYSETRQAEMRFLECF